MMIWTALLSSSAFAQDEEPVEAEPTAEEAEMERAKTLFENGRALFKEARYREAIAAWEACYELTGRNELFYNLANAHERLAEYEESIAALNRYRAFAKADEKVELERRIDNLERLAEEKAKREEEAKAAAQPVVAPPPEPEPEKGVNGRKVLGIGLIGVGVASLGTGATLGLLSKQAGDRALEFCVGDTDPLCHKDAQADLDANRGLALGADVAFGVGVASTVVGALLVVTGKGQAVQVGPNSIRWNGRF